MSHDEQFLPAGALDPNAWYHLTEQAVDDFVEDAKDFTKILLAKDSSSGDLAIGDNDGKTKQYWQFQPIDEGEYKARYAIRANVDEVNKQLGVCRVDDESSESKTRPCMLPSDGSDVQKWDIDRWNGTQTYRFINVANGTKYWMDCNKDNTPFMNNNIDLSTRQPGQHWYMSSISAVDDERYSTIFGSPSSSSSSSDPTDVPGGSGASSGNNGQLSTGAKAGIGIGAALAVIAISVLAAIFFRRRHRRHKQHQALPLPSQLSSPASTIGVPAYSRIGENKDFQSDAATYDSYMQRSQTVGAHTVGAQTLGGQTVSSQWHESASSTDPGQHTISELAGDYSNQPHELHGDHGHSRV